ncbi:hypothetical protein FHQ08_09015 [Lactobacillus sp. CC-MHH1034]|uniref:hypothetical protein n=1 Tax=Agrilactobacillus fermenti TaxID=2586909 RepID=UPI001E506687|nr:hypothetical protein [Agrilactobacillus fermenti]MCD2256862.1 hypothetical protein [Agrilactobacillus fermenti]
MAFKKNRISKFSVANVLLQVLIVSLGRNSLKRTIPVHFSFNGVPDSYIYGAKLTSMLMAILVINFIAYLIYMLPLNYVLPPIFADFLKQIKIIFSIWLYVFSWNLLPFFFHGNQKPFEYLMFIMNVLLLFSWAVVIVKKLILKR